MSDTSWSDPMRQVDLTHEDTLTPEAINDKLVERELALMQNEANRGKPCHCPHCGFDFHSGVIPQESILKGYYKPKCDECGRPNHWSSKVGISDPELDRTTHWHCQNCGTTWPR